MKNREKISELPKCMAERAIWAREAFKADNNNIDFDEEILPWAYNEKDELWYSFDGNYSSSSPAEKRKKALIQKQKNENLEIVAQERFNDYAFWSKIRAEILARDNNECQLCGASKSDSRLCIHHILKRKKGGKEFFDNLITVCQSCHTRADNKLYNPKWENHKKNK